MLRKIVLLYLVLAGAAFAADQPARPYAQLPGLEFGKDKTLTDAIVKEVETAPAAGRAAIEARLLQAAQQTSATFACKAFVADMLRVVGSKACLPVVLKWLADPKTANLATLSLQGMNDPTIIRPLARAMRGAQGNIKIQLIQALAVRRANAIVADLVKLAKGQDETLARVAVDALGNIGTPESAKALMALQVSEPLKNARETALVVCAGRLQKDGKKDAAQEIWKSLYEKSGQAGVVVAALNGRIEADGAAALPVALGALKDKRPRVAILAAGAARNLAGPDATRGLCEALPVLPAPVQVALLRTLGVRGDKAAYPAVQTAMNSQDEAVKCEAVRACETLADASAAEPLLKLAAGSGEAAAAAKQVLARINQPALDATLMRQLDSPQSETVSVAAGVLVARGYRAATPRLLALAGSPDSGIRSAAFAALKSFAVSSDVPELFTLLAKAAPADRSKVTQILWTANQGISAKDQRFMTLWQAAPATNTDVRVALLPLAAQAGGAEPLKVVKAHLVSKETKVKDVAIRALCAWPDDSASSDTLKVLKTTDSVTYRALAADALRTRLTDTKSRMPLAQRQQLLRDALASLERPQDKQTIQFALDKLSQPNALPNAQGTGRGTGRGNRRGMGNRGAGNRGAVNTKTGN